MIGDNTMDMGQFHQFVPADRKAFSILLLMPKVHEAHIQAEVPDGDPLIRN
ncbi:hypothetical protein HH214_09580 [Mucilaginibacter robiniae]|uniref:Uncharacterized protein n=1 Tax=Mucilaginibacter robiniae TaxID=2728022 RepID=A0A7L5E151_9SPHI|nr:hypothetical protein [Mucilaginibacter robiniae]QJD96107.1 hypothetical protein HH214_09580 [Mucilaginibacter robiniae]